MAFITIQFCYVCGEKTEHLGDKCCGCLERKQDIDRQIKEDAWNDLDIEGKLDYLYKRL